MSTCRSCEAPVLWAETAAGKKMPLDEAPSPKGTWIYVNGKTWHETVEDRAVKRPVHTSHFATCPNAAQHRKAR